MSQIIDDKSKNFLVEVVKGLSKKLLEITVSFQFSDNIKLSLKRI